MKNKFLTYLGKLAFLVMLSGVLSCGTRQDVVYFQNVDVNSASTSISNYSSTIKPADLLTITVSALDQDAVRPFNLRAVTFTDEDGNIGRSTIQTYLVDTNGNIEFPVLGTLKLAGLNRIQATALINNLLKDYVKNPIVNIRITNFTVTVLGEVRTPGQYTIANERITILEALGLAGDLTLQAKRENILLIREEGGKKTYNRLDLTSETIFNSKYYYLSQNDVIYVEPNNSQIKSSTVGPNTNATLGVISTLVTVAALVVSLVNN